MKKATLEFKGEQFSRFYITDREEASAICKKIAGKPLYGLDIETARRYGREEEADGPKPGLDPRLSFIRLVQVYDGTNVYVFDVLHFSSERLIEFLTSHTFVAHNAVFELSHLQPCGFSDLDIHCSMIMALMVDVAEHSPFEKEEDEEDEEQDGSYQYRKLKGASLDSCVRKYFDAIISKEYQTSNWNQPELENEQINYAALDAVLTYKLYTVLWPKLEKYKLVKSYKLFKEVQFPVVEMQYNGFGLDARRLKKHIKEWEHERQSEERKCREFFGGINLRSSKQLGEWLVKSGKDTTEWPRTRTGAYSFTRGKLARFIDEKEIQALLEYKRFDKLLTTYGGKLISQCHRETKRLHPSFSIARTRTGRLSSFNPNLQNLPRDSAVRECFVPSNGTSLVTGDYAQIELRVAGELSKDETILYAQKKGLDLHKFIVADVLEKRYSEVTKEERQMGKAINFGFLFGMGARKLVEYAKLSYGVALTEAQAERAWKVFKKRYHKYTLWSEKQRQLCSELGFVRTPLGRMRKLLPEESYTKSVNHPVQGGAAEVCFVGLLAVLKLLPSHMKLVNCVHDEIILEVRKGSEEEAAAILKKAMEHGYKFVFPEGNVAGLCEIGYGDNWKEAKA